MGNFIEKCSCSRVMPASLADALQRATIPRNNLVSRLLTENDKINCLCAPDGFGKTCLSAQYVDARSISKSVYWVDCANPSFRLHLSKRDFAKILSDDAKQENSLCRKSTSKMNVSSGSLSAVVFDTYEFMSEKDHENFNDLCDTLKAGGWEVLVCCTPRSFPFTLKTEEDKNRYTVYTAKDLTFSDEELQLLYLVAKNSVSLHISRKPAFLLDRIPSLALQQQGSYKTFIKDCLESYEYKEKAIRAFGIALLGKGSQEDLLDALGFECRPPNEHDIKHHPHIGWNTQGNLFDVTGFPFSEIVSAFHPFLSKIEERNNQISCEKIALRSAEFVLQRGEYMRSAQIVAGFCSAAGCVSWLERHQWDLFDRAIVIPCEIVFNRLHGYVREPEIEVGNIARRMILKKSKTQIYPFSELLAFSNNPRVSDRAIAALCCAMIIGNVSIESEVGQEYSSDLRHDPSCHSNNHKSNNHKSDNRFNDRGDIKKISPVLLAREMMQLHSFSDAFKQTQAYQSLATYLFSDQEAELPEIDFPDQASLYAILMVRLCTHFSAESMRDTSDIAHTLGAHGWSESHRRTHDAEAPTNDNNMQNHMMRVSHATSLLLSNQIEYSKRGRKRESSRQTSEPEVINAKLSVRHIHVPSSAHSATSPSSADSHFEVNLLGRFSVKVNKKRIDPEKFARRKTMALLALLLLNPSGISTEKLAKNMWPKSPADTAKRNLYSLWSILRSSLQISPESTSPLVRENGMCRIEKGRVTSDIYEVWDICSKLTNPSTDARRFAQLLTSLKSLYLGELLPGLSSVAELNNERKLLKQRISRSLLTSSRTFVARAYHELALSCAEFALEVDPTKEEAYESLFALQIICGQRPQATQTWCMYNEFMSSNLGLDPSLLSKQMYQCLLDDDIEGAKMLLLRDKPLQNS